MPALSTVVLVLATAPTGLTAGVFGLYSKEVMPGLRATDDLTFVGAFQSIDRAIINPVWLGRGFFGVLSLTAAAVCLHLDVSSRPVLPWIVAAFILHAVVWSTQTPKSPAPANALAFRAGRIPQPPRPQHRRPPIRS